MKKVEVRAVIQYLCKKGMTPKEIHEYFMKTLGNKSPSYITVKKWAAEFKRLRERALMMTKGLTAPKMPPLMKMWRSLTTWLHVCVTGGETCEV